MMRRQTALRSLSVGDIFHATDLNSGITRICLVTSLTDATIFSRTITTQDDLEFDRRSGGAEHVLHGDHYRYSVDSVAVLPADIQAALVGLDRRYHEAARRQDEDPNYEWPPEVTRLTQAEKQALLFINSFYPANPLPEA